MSLDHLSTSNSAQADQPHQIEGHTPNGSSSALALVPTDSTQIEETATQRP